MKKLTALSVAVIIALLIVLVYFLPKSPNQETPSSKQASLFHFDSSTDTFTGHPVQFHHFEKFTGFIDGKPTTLVILETAYIIANERGNAKFGIVNTARGFEQDADATVYELDWRQAERSRQIFVRLTSVENRIFKLDNSGKIIKDSFLSASGSTP